MTVDAPAVRSGPEIDNFSLRRVGAPYFGLAIILLGVSGFSLFVHFDRPDGLPWEALFEEEAILLAPFAFVVYIGTRYRVSWHDGMIVQKAFRMPVIFINAGDITQVKQETSDAKTLLSMNRPFRRITIYAGHPQRGGKFIDVSLKHFANEDVTKLMQAVHAARPELSLPARFLH